MHRYLIYMLAVLIFQNCSLSEKEEMGVQEEEVVAETMVVIDLSEKGLPLKFLVDSVESKDLKMEWNAGFGRMEVNGPDGINFFIVQDSISCRSKKEEIESGIFEIEYFQDDEDILFYEAKLPHGSSSYFHYFASIHIGGEIFNFENNPLVEFSQHEIARMVELTKTFKSSKIE